MDSLRSQAIGRSTSDPPERVAGLPDLNILPARYRPTRPTLLTIGAWLLFAALVGLLYPSYLRFQEATASLQIQRLRLEAVQERLIDTEVQPQQLEEARAQIEAAREEAAGLRQALAEVQIQRVLWGPQASAIVEVVPEAIEIKGLRHDQDSLQIVGTALEYGAVLDYAYALRSVEGVESVSVEGIARIDPEQLEAQLLGETAMPTAEEAEAVATEIAASEAIYGFTIRATIAGAQAEEVAP